MANGVNLSVGIEDNTQQGLNSILTNVTSWNKKAGKAAILEAKVRFNNKDFDAFYDNWENASKKAATALKKFGSYWEDAKPKNRKNPFAGWATNLNVDNAVAALQKLKHLRTQIDSGSLKPADWTAAESRRLDNLILQLQTATDNYKLMQRAQSKLGTRLTTAAANSAAKQEQEERRKQAKLDNLDRKRFAYELSEQTKLDKKREDNVRLQSLAVELEQKRAAITGNSIKDMQSRNRLAEREIEIYKELQKRGAGDYTSNIKSLQGSLLDTDTISYMRKRQLAETALTDATSANNLQNQVKAWQDLQSLAKQRFEQTGSDEYLKEYQSIQKTIDALKEKIATEKKAASEPEAATRRINRELDKQAEAEANLKDAEEGLAEAKKANKGKNVAQVKDEITATQKAIEARRAYLKAHNKQPDEIRNDSVIKQYQRQLLTLKQQRDAIIAYDKALLGMKNTLHRIAGFFGIAFNLQTITNFGRKIAETTGYFEQQRVALEGIVQDSTKAAAIFNQLKDFSVRSPFQFKELVGFTKQLSAFQIPADELFDTTKKLADISAGLGVDMSRIILAFGQVRSAAVLRGQELRQFTEAGIPLVDALAKKFTALEGRVVSTADVFERISKRQVSFEMVRDILFEMTEEGGRFNNMQEKIANTTYGRIQNLKDYWTIAMSEMGQETSGLINGILKLLQALAKNWRATFWTLSGTLIGMSSMVFNHIKKKAIEAGVSVKRFISGWFKANWISLAVTAVITMIFAIVGAIKQARAEAEKLKNTLKDIDEKAGEKAGELVVNFKKLVKALQETTEGSEAERKAYEKLLSVYSEYLPQQDLELKKLRELKDGYDELTHAILAQVQAKADAEKREAVMQAVSSDITRGIANAKMIRRLTQPYTGFDAPVDFWEGFDKSAKKVLQTELQNFLNGHILDSSKEELANGIVEIMRPYIDPKVRSDADLQTAAETMLKTAMQTINKPEAQEVLGLGYDEETISSLNAAVKAQLKAGTIEYTAFRHLYRLFADEDRKTQERIKQVIGDGKKFDKTQQERLTDAEWVRGMANKYRLAGVEIDDTTTDELIAAVQNGTKGREEAMAYLQQIASNVGIINKTTKTVAVNTSEIPFTKEALYTDKSGRKANKAEQEKLDKLWAYIPSIMKYLSEEDRRNLDFSSAFRSEEHDRQVQKEAYIREHGTDKGFVYRGTSQHIKGEAIDLRIGDGRDKAANERLFKAILASNVAFGQLLIEQASGAEWTHISLPNNKWSGDIKEYNNGKYQSGTQRLQRLQQEANVLRDEIDNANTQAEMTENELTNYNKAVQNLLELQLQQVEKQLQFYKKYEKKVNEYIDQLSDNGSSKDAVIKLVYSMFRMSPQTNKGEYEKKLKAEYDNAVSGLKARIQQNPNALLGSDLDKEVRDWLNTIDYLKKIADMINLDLNTGKSGEKTQRAYKAVADLFKVIKEGRKELSQIGAYKGYEEGLEEFVNTLDDNSVLKQFMDKDKNPFDEYLDALSAIGIDTTSMNKIVNKTIKGTKAPDFQAMWKQLEDVLKTEIKKLTKNNFGGVNDKTIADLQRLYNQYFVEGKNVFSGDIVKNALDKAINELKKITTNTERQIKVYDTFKQLTESIGWENAYKMMYGKDGYYTGHYLNASEIYSNQLKKMITKENKGVGALLGDKLGLTSLLDSGAMNISNLGALFGIIQQFTDENNTPSNLSEEEFNKIKSQFTEVLNKLINAILEESKQTAASASQDEKMVKTIESITNRLEVAKDRINKAKPEEISDKAQATVEAIQKSYDEIRKALGGTETQSYTKRFFGDAKSATGIKKGGELLEQILGGMTGNGANLQQMISDGIAKSWAKDGTLSKIVELQNKIADANTTDEDRAAAQQELEGLTGAANNAAGALALVDAIIKAVYQSIKAVTETIESTIQLMESQNRLYAQRDSAGRVAIDDDGNVQVSNRYDADRIARTRKGLEITNTFNDHVMSGWESLKSGNVLGAVMHTVTMWTDLVKGINELLDLGKAQEQERLGKEIEKLDRHVSTLEFNQNFMTQSQKFKSQAEEVNTLYQERLDIQRQLELETQKKAGDADKAQEYADQMVEKERQALEIVQGIREEIVGTADDLSSRLTDAMVDAFRNGTNAARAWRDQVKQYIGDMLKEQLLASVFAPQLQRLMDNLLGGTAEELKSMADNDPNFDYNKWVKKRLSDTSKVQEFEQGIIAIGDAMIDLHDSMPDSLKDLIDYNSSVQSLSGGIESVTEDTARRLEALSNSQLGEQMLMRTLLQNHLAWSETFFEYSFADIQTSLARIDSNTSLLLTVQRTIENHISELRDTSSRPLHVQMV